MLTKTFEEMVERRRARYTAWAKEFGFPPPSPSAGSQELKEYAREFEEELEEADLLSEINRILGRDA